MPAFSSIIMGIGALASAGGAIQKGIAESDAGEYNAKIAEQNAQQAEIQAAEDERVHRVIARKQIGQMQASYSASGITSEGSPMEVLQESAANAEMDAHKIRQEGANRARAFREGATLDQMGASAARTGGYMGGASSLLRGATDIAANVKSNRLTRTG